MMILKRGAVISSLLLAACAHAPQHAVVAQPAPRKAAAIQKTELPPLKLPKVNLTGAMLYEFLLGDIASQRGNPQLAARIYLSLAQETQDPRVARRAAQLAFEAHDMKQSVEALELWLKLDPSSSHAKQLLTAVLLNGGKLADARPYLKEMLAENPDQVGNAFMQIYSMLARQPDKKATLELLHELAQPYPDVPEAHLVQAQAAIAAGDRKRALEEVRQTRALHPEWEGTVLLEAQLLERDAPQEVPPLLKKYLDSHPDSSSVRLLYARTLLKRKQYVPARQEFRRLLAKHPENANLAFAVAMLSLQMGKLDQAEQELRESLAKGKKDQGTVYYYLGQLNEAKKQYDAALQDYQKVQEGQYAFTARLRVAYLLSREGKLDEARAYLHQTDVQDNEQRVQLLLVEAQVLHDAKQTEAAFDVLKQGLDKLPNHPDLLYEAAMLADQLGKLDVFEQMMRKVIEIKPDYAQAYNALGYSLLDRNIRLKEGMQLVEKALQLAPDDASIIDSVGWGHYRLGELQQGEEYLRRAYKADPDPEIAAHLGEVIWMQGSKDQAKKIWGDALKEHPDNALLLSTMKRLDP